MIALSSLPLCKGKLSLFLDKKLLMFSNVDTMLSQDPPSPPPNQLMILGVHDKWDAYETW